ncbi:hypothetical protein [Glycomyces salinus]|uniref:hypothetical protein n=1 Tax=Glycomyces salinus TaxID=980294 RepID=UPI0018EA614C|nr:hypothetical protein [Glycomyces salinus]
MTDTPQGAADVAEYRLAVERHLADLPEPIREDLLNGLEDHLTEVAADREPGTTLEDLLGRPEAYARELRETAEIESEGRRDGFWRSVQAGLEPSVTWIRAKTEQYTASAGVGEAGEFRRKLKPGWWVLRGLAAAALVYYLIAGGAVLVTLPVLSEGIVQLLVFAVMALPFVWLSLRLGAMSEQWGIGRRRLVALGGVVLVWLGLLPYATLPSLYGPDYGQSFVADFEDPNEGVTNIYPYTEDGEPLAGVYLFDQDGNPLWIGDPDACDRLHEDPFGAEGYSDEAVPTPDPLEEGSYDEAEYGYLYPLCDSDPWPTDEASGLPVPEDSGASGPTGEQATEPVDPGGEQSTAPAEDSTPSPEPTE